MTLEDLVREVFPKLIERDNGEIYTDCPFCEERGETRDTRTRLGINCEAGTWNCFNCHYRGRDNPEWLFRELVRIFDLPYSEYNFSWRSTLEKKKVHERQELHPVPLPKEFEALWEKPTDSIHKRALKYVLNRGVTNEQVEEHFVGFCAAGKYTGRIIFPVYRKENVIGFVARSFLKDEKLRYLNSDGLKYLWNAPSEKKRKGLLIEGIFDALAGERILDEVHVMAGLGHTLTDEQIKPLLKFKELVLVPDPDRVGIVGTIKRARQIIEAGEGVKLYVVMPKEGIYEDWGKWGETEKGLRKISRAYERKVPWTRYTESKLRMQATYL